MSLNSRWLKPILSLRSRWLVPVVLLIAVPSLRAQTVTLYDGFTGTSLDKARWSVINEEGSAMATATVGGGILTVNGVDNRSGVASLVRLPSVGAVEATALGWTGTNQILQLYSGDGYFNHFIEYGEEGTAADGTPILNVWTTHGRLYRANSPVTGPASPSNPTTLRIERNGQSYRFLANGQLVFSTTDDSLNNDARVMLYGWRSSVSKWTNVKISGPDCRINAPADGTAIGAATEIWGWCQDTVTSWILQYGAGASPTNWTTLATGSSPVNGKLATFDAGSLPGGTYALRLVASDASGQSRAAWSTVRLAKPALYAPFEGERVGTSFAVLMDQTTSAGYVKADYYDNGTLFATSTDGPLFRVRRVEPDGADGTHAINAVLTDAGGNAIPSAPVNVIVQRDLFGGNTRPADIGKAFVFPWGQTTVAIGQNDGYLWAGCVDLYNGNAAATENYVADLQSHGVNVMRIMMDEGNDPADFLENPIGTWNPKVVAFWDQFFAICNRHHMTVLVTPWDTFWMNSGNSWSTCAYNSANGGPCATVHDFIVNPAARQAQKNRFKFIIDRWGNNPAIFAIDLLNEFDIWWNASTAERADWINDMANYVQTYELQKWGHRHMLTVSTAAAVPGGTIGDIQFRYPLFDFSNTHQYDGPINNPQNIIDPALDVNRMTKLCITQTPDDRPYFDSESGPISLSAPWLTNNTTFDDQYYHHMAWAHFATGGTGIGQRWPYRIPHYLDEGMHLTEGAVASVAAGLDFTRFRPVNIDGQLSIDKPNIILMGSSDGDQSVVWMTEDTRSQPAQTVSGANLTISGLSNGPTTIWCSNPYTGNRLVAAQTTLVTNGTVVVPLPNLTLDMAVTARHWARGDVNGDFATNISDFRWIVRYTAGFVNPTPIQAAASDLNGDGHVDLTDAALEMRLLDGLDTAQ